MDGTKRHGYQTLPEAMVNLRILLNEPRNPRYIGFYFGDVDSIMHKYGPVSQHARAEIETMLRYALAPILAPVKRTSTWQTLFLLTVGRS